MIKVYVPLVNSPLPWVHVSRRSDRIGFTDTGSGAKVEIGTGLDKPIEDKVTLTREGILQNQLLRGLNISCSLNKSNPIHVTPENMDKVISNWARTAKISTDDVKLISLAYAFAADNGYEIHQAFHFDADYSFWAGINKRCVGNSAASESEEALANKFIGSTAFETSKIPQDFLLMAFDPLQPGVRGINAQFLADFARYLSDAPDAEFNGSPAKAKHLLNDYRERLNW